MIPGSKDYVLHACMKSGAIRSIMGEKYLLPQLRDIRLAENIIERPD